MPKGNKSYSFGGQRRTFICPCGFHIQGHPTQLTLKLRLHKKVCEEAMKGADNKELNIEFNTDKALANGWKGFDAKKGGKANATATVFCEGEYVGEIDKDEAIEAFTSK